MALLASMGCSSLLGIEDLSGGGPGDGGNGDGGSKDGPGPAAQCRAQRVVAIVAGNGSLSWFTLAWPAPAVITQFSPNFAYDDPALARSVSSDPDHPLFTRVVRANGAPIWDNVGRVPHPTVFVAGSNETHTSTPVSIANAPGSSVLAAGAALQAPLAPRIPVITIGNVGSYGTAAGAPTNAVAGSVENAIPIITGTGAASDAQIRPSAAQLNAYLTDGSPQTVIDMASKLAFAANAFRTGTLGTLIITGFNDDPHGAFDANLATTRADQLSQLLDAFYRDLAQSDEPACGDGGNFLSLADNTTLIVFGDTPKNSFARAGWADGTPGNSNWIYVRGNGFTKPGWFGQIQPQIRTNFDPATGKLDGMASVAASTNAAWAGTLYAISRGNLDGVAQYTNAPFQGVIAQ